MRKNFGIVSVLAVCIFAAQGCAHGGSDEASRRLDQKLASEPALQHTADLRAEVADTIQNSKNLTPEQRRRLLELRKESNRESDRLREESLKIRALLVQEVVSPNYNETEVKALQEKFRKVEDERLTHIFRTANRANEILGHWPSENSRERRDEHNQMMYDLLDALYD